MKSYPLRTYPALIILVLGILFNSACSQKNATSTLKLWYKQPAEKWTEALPLGNGRLGAMVFGGVEKEHIQFNEETLWTVVQMIIPTMEHMKHLMR